MTEKEKMIQGLPYNAGDEELEQLRFKIRKHLGVYNQLGQHDYSIRFEQLKTMLGQIGSKSVIEPPFYCDYGFNINIGHSFYMNFDCVILDVSPVIIGNNVMCGPKVQILTATHSINSQERNFSGTELGKSVKIGDRAWLGAGAIICPGITIGEDSVIGAGSVVTRDIPNGVLAAGNPCRVIKNID